MAWGTVLEVLFHIVFWIWIIALCCAAIYTWVNALDEYDFTRKTPDSKITPLRAALLPGIGFICSVLGIILSIAFYWGWNDAHNCSYSEWHSDYYYHTESAGC